MSLSVDQNTSQSMDVLSDDHNKENTDYSSLKFSQILFTDDSGLGLHFAMRPCRERKTVRTLIERGGGYMSSYNLYSDQMINLVIKQHQKSSDSNLKLYYLTFVYDSCKANTLLDSNQYLFQKTTTVEKCSECEESEGQLNDINGEQIDNNPNENSCDQSTTQDLSQTNECLEQKDVKQSIEDNVSESDLDSDRESDETKSKYFKTNQQFIHKRKDKSDKKKKYFKAYLDFIQQRETTNTPENLMRIKNALKASIEEQTNQTTDNQSLIGDKNEPKLSKDMPFGAKVVTKTRNETEKHKESKSQETGYQVSDISSEENSDHQKRIQRIRPQMINRKLKPNKNVFKHNNYCLTEDESILEFLVKTKRFDELKGILLWQEAEKQGICEGRSWQSMKERFRKQIMPNIDSYDITKYEKKKFKVCYYSTDKSLDTTRVQSGGYTFEEDMAIIKSVINRNGYELVKGTKFWKQTEEELKHKKVCDRSWQSLKERYLKRIVPFLDKFEIKLELAKKIVKWTGLTENEQQLVLRKCQKSLLKPKPKKRALDIRQVQNNQQTEQTISSDTEIEEQTIEGSSQRSKRIKK